MDVIASFQKALIKESLESNYDIVVLLLEM